MTASVASPTLTRSSSPSRWRSFALVGFPLTLGSAIAASTSMVLRLRRSHGVEREQLKWIAFAAAIVAVAFVCHLTLSFSGLGDRIEWYGVLWGMALCGLPLAAGIAILRRGLFDIDLVVNRTLVYTVLTALVAGLYIFVVTGVGALFQTEGGWFCRSSPPASSPLRSSRCDNGCSGQ